MSQPDPRDQELRVLKTIAHALNGSLTLDEALSTTLDESAQLFGLETGWIWLLDPESEAPYLAAARALPPALVDHPERMTGGCYCLDGFRDGELEVAANVHVIRCSRLRHLKHGTAGLAFHTSVPIEAHGRKLGLLKGAPREELFHAIRVVAAGGSLLAPTVAARMIAGATGTGASSSPGDKFPPLAEPLTPREQEVLGELAEGQTNREIAARLGVTERTVKSHVTAILAKLEAGNRTEAVRIAVRRGLVVL